MNVEYIRSQFAKGFKANDFTIDKSSSRTIEIINAVFYADEPAIFGTVNEDYVERELAWYKSQSLNVNDIPGETPAIWKQVADKDGFINSNYGWCIYSEENGHQFASVLEELVANPYSRRANMIYTRPSMHKDYNKNGMSDFICTNNVQYHIRNGQLVTSVFMRSNDAVFGYKNDFAWQKYVRDQLLLGLRNRTNVEYGKGPIIWNVGNLHVYDRHFKFIEEYEPKEMTWGIV